MAYVGMHKLQTEWKACQGQRGALTLSSTLQFGIRPRRSLLVGFQTDLVLQLRVFTLQLSHLFPGRLQSRLGLFQLFIGMFDFSLQLLTQLVCPIQAWLNRTLVAVIVDHDLRGKEEAAYCQQGKNPFHGLQIPILCTYHSDILHHLGFMTSTGLRPRPLP